MIAMESGPSSIRIIPKEQRLSDAGFWSRGRTLSAKRLFHQDDLDYLTEQDKQISSFIKRKRSSSGGIFYAFDVKPALLAMADHRVIFWADAPHIHLEIKKAGPELRITENENSIHLTFYPLVEEERIIIQKENQNLLKIFSISEEQQKVAEIIGPYGVSVPKNEKNQILQTIGRTASFLNVFSDISGIDTSHKKREPDSRLHMQLTPAGNGFILKMFVRPFNSQGPYFLPGVGPVTIFSEINGEPLQATRNLKIEEKNAAELLNTCPLLHLYKDKAELSSSSAHTKLMPLRYKEMEWALPSPVECLEFLYCLQDNESVVLEWPQGEQLKISQAIKSSQCHLKIYKKNKWFEVDGHIEMDESEIMTIRQALESIRHSNSRFIQLKDGKFIALAEELYNYLQILETTTEEERDSIRFLPFAHLDFDEFSRSGFQVEYDRDWQERFAKMQSAEQLNPQVPSTLKAVLRDYQLTGFRWMMKLSHWGAGACLADDMGIGKTIQALAVILAKAAQGPSLVIAPTSVCFNWQEEMDRFTPTLSAHSFNGENRRKTIENLGPFDVFITSYGLLQQEEALMAKKWQVIVLDEAQAIKNAHTKRSDAAMKLNGSFKIITTGTPIENNLGELWNLFRFINPGLLGTIKQFNNRFAGPIEKEENNTQKNKLKNLIAPFVLRRLKSQVLQELPARTEVNLFVDFSEEERNFYEALRRQALEKLGDFNHQGRMRIQILAEIMKLRRACCNPRLILPETDIESSKLALFEKTITELRANNHKILVFSQFVGHLSLIKEVLHRKNISYQYLDGSTPPLVRKTRVNAFQNGIGDVFLISLKAGGVGLNLTAANYVIHMDPWWNPAVEDQASDRAHRIGQKNPVTIYRLITRNSIEEKIIKLHQEKKDLANSLLEGNDLGENFSAEALLQLLQEG
jgi:SNF2 family DNA or RNA helicase